MSRLGNLTLSLVCTLGSALPLAGQTGAGAQASARGQVRLVIRPVLHLEAASTEAEVIESGDGVEVRGAVRVRVSANAPWRLVVRGRNRTVADAATRGADGLVDAVWVRATPGALGFARSLASGYTLMSAGRLAVAEGAPGADQEVVVDYRWMRSGTGPDPDPDDLIVELAER